MFDLNAIQTKNMHLIIKYYCSIIIFVFNTHPIYINIIYVCVYMQYACTYIYFLITFQIYINGTYI